ncbi:leukocyte antigen CD37 isoform X8 [Oryctolagus cuniculus]|uniref:leukocyte antigen CD37 isoform X8 n=1 Tax=Oryctolagus cuniculus TaxID=9986 RepID=UPI0038790A40
METWEEGLPPVALVPSNSKAPQVLVWAGEHVGPGELPQPHQILPLRLQPLLLCPRQPHFLLRYLDTHRQDQLRVLCLSFVPLQIWSKVLAISGILTMGLALLGCVGALKELRCLLGLYFGMLLLLFATQITLGILISTQRVRLERKVQDVVLDTIRNYRADPEETAAEESWDYVQFQLGRLGPRSRPRHNTDLCVVQANGYIYREGCAQSLQKWLHNNLISIVGICLAVGLLELGFMTLSIFLCRNLDHVYNRLARPRPPGPALPRAPPRPFQVS